MTSQNQTMENKILVLEKQLATLTSHLEMERARKVSRVKLIKRTSVVGALLVSSIAIAGIVSSSGANLQQFMNYDGIVNPPPLDSLATWGRTDDNGGTSELLSLIADGSQESSFQWPLYIELRGTTNPNAQMGNSQSVGATVRAFSRSTGTPWLAGFHSEIHHGEDSLNGTHVAANGTSLLFNGEMYSYTNTGVRDGINLQCSYDGSPYATNCSNAINIQPSTSKTVWQNGIHFDQLGGGGVSGNIGINFDQSSYLMGLDLANNSMRMNAGQKIALEKYGSVYLMFNPNTGNVELYKNNVLVAKW